MRSSGQANCPPPLGRRARWRGEDSRLIPLESDSLHRSIVLALEGRLALNDGEDGGSGRLEWRTSADDSELSFRGALGRGAWRLESDASGARLSLADGSSWESDSLDDLVRRHAGWQVPVTELSWWARGLAAPGGWQTRDLDPDGNLALLEQAGWRIEYSAYRDVSSVAMPGRMTARKQDYTVKLAIRRWSLDAGGEADD